MIWASIKARTLNPNNKSYRRYGIIGMSERLAADFTAFMAEVGLRPSKDYSIDRIDNTKGYIEGNLRWATRSEQESNKSNSYIVTVNGENFSSLHEAARKFKVSVTTIARWCDGYYDKRRNTTTPPKERCNRVRKYAI